MWNKRDTLRTGIAFVASLAVLGSFRFVIYDYSPPETLVNTLQSSVFISNDLRRPAMLVYGIIVLVLLALFLQLVQQRWPGRGVVKGMIFGAMIGVVWAFGFLSGWAFLGTTLRAELLNGIIDIIALMIAGGLFGWAIGHDVSKSEQIMWRPWLAIVFIAFGFVLVHTVATLVVADLFTSAAHLLLLPSTPSQFLALGGLGIWAGCMYIILRAGLPFDSAWTRSTLFAFGIFGHCWTLFHLFFVIEFAGVLPVVLVLGLIGATGVFAGTLAYEAIAAREQQAD